MEMDKQKVISTCQALIKVAADCLSTFTKADADEEEMKKTFNEVGKAFGGLSDVFPVSEIEYEDADEDEEDDGVEEAQKAETPKEETPKAEGTISKVIAAVSRIMTMPQANKRINELQADNQNLSATLVTTEKAFQGALKDIETVSAEKKQLADSIETLKTDHAKALETMKAEYEAKLASATKTVEDTKLSLGNAVVNELKAVGIQQGEIKEEVAPALTPKVAFDTFNTMKAGPQRTEYFKQNEKLIMAHQKEVMKAGRNS